jgi:hypothetical protein
MTIDGILREILRCLKTELPTQSTLRTQNSTTESTESEVGAKFVLDAGIKQTQEDEATSEKVEEKKHVDGYSTDIQFISSKLKELNKRLVFEDFHYLTEERRIDIAFLLKAFFEYGIFVVIIGIWAEQNLLIYYNGDLSGRVEEINISWNDLELEEVIKKGEPVLNIHFSDEIKREIISSSVHNVGMLQRLVEKICLIEGIFESQDTLKEINSLKTLDEARNELVTEIGQKFNRIKEVFERGFRANTELKLYYQIFRLLTEISEEKLINGISQNEILQKLQEYDDKIRQSDLTASLIRIEKLQVDRRINPLLVTYNHKLRLLILGDREFIFFRKYNKIPFIWATDKSASVPF